MNEVDFWLGFSLIPGIGAVRFHRLLDHFGGLERAWTADRRELQAAGLDDRAISAIINRRPKIALADEVKKVKQARVSLLTWNDSAYPAKLKEIYDSPPVLYVRGALTAADEWAVSIVGTRRATTYGKEATERIVSDLARNGITIVSGLARGIDTAAHQAALNAGGRTIAVLGCGIDMVYPSENLKLARSILDRGALISEFPLGTQPLGKNFRLRNRIMSGMSLGVLVVEAGESSGANITADYALEQNREVFAVPGSIFSPMSRGTNRLIQEGAKPVVDAKDILEELNLTMAAHQLEMKELIPVDDLESQIIKQISYEPTHIDEVRRQCGLPIATVSSTLAMLELKGAVRQVGAMNYVLARETRAEYEVKVE